MAVLAAGCWLPITVELVSTPVSTPLFLPQNFVEMEKLDGSESYKCEHCKKCQPHTKRLQIWRPPRVLVITLKRFSARSASTSIFSRFRCATG